VLLFARVDADDKAIGDEFSFRVQSLVFHGTLSRLVEIWVFVLKIAMAKFVVTPNFMFFVLLVIWVSMFVKNVVTGVLSGKTGIFRNGLAAKNRAGETRVSGDVKIMFVGHANLVKNPARNCRFACKVWYFIGSASGSSASGIKFSKKFAFFKSILHFLKSFCKFFLRKIRQGTNVI